MLFAARTGEYLADAPMRSIADVIAFGARAMGEARGAKYVNTPESELFHKRKQIYAADLARAAAAKSGAGRALRSTLPCAVSGKASSRTSRPRALTTSSAAAAAGATPT